MHVLDNPAWHALTGPHATVAERVGSAARYEPDVSVFAALPDQITPAAWDDLRELIGPGGAAFIARSGLEVGDGWTVHFERPCRQMWQPHLPKPDAPQPDRPSPVEGRGDASSLARATLGAGDVAEMLALVARTEPGPFAARTVELGSYLGVRDSGALIAMAGERMHPPGFTEISAVCTDSGYRGRGLASELVTALSGGIRARTEVPFLHLTLENEPAHRVYSALGFETRGFLDVVGVRAPR